MTQDANRSLTRKGWFWALVPVFLLSATAIGVLTVVSIAVDDQGFSVEKDYYKQAVHFDAELAQRKHNAELGWQLDTNVSLVAPNTLVTAQLRDREARPISGATLEANAFALARGQLAEQLRFQETLPGTYEAKLSSHRGGLWEFRMTALQGTERFTKTIRVDAVP